MNIPPFETAGNVTLNRFNHICPDCGCPMALPDRCGTCFWQRRMQSRLEYEIGLKRIRGWLPEALSPTSLTSLRLLYHEKVCPDCNGQGFEPHPFVRAWPDDFTEHSILLQCRSCGRCEDWP